MWRGIEEKEGNKKRVLKTPQVPTPNVFLSTSVCIMPEEQGLTEVMFTEGLLCARQCAKLHSSRYTSSHHYG